jgi:hypothetical protein
MLRLLKNILTKTIISLVCIGFAGNSISAVTVISLSSIKHTKHLLQTAKINPIIEKNIHNSASTAINEGESSRCNEKTPFDTTINYILNNTDKLKSNLKNYPIKRLIQRNDEVKGFFVKCRLE